MDIQIIFAILFVIILGVFLIIKRKQLDVQKVFFPFIYIILYRTKLGIKLMDKISSKYREYVKLFGYISIGIGFVGMIYISVAVLLLMLKLVFQPMVTQPGMVLVLPFTNIPGIGFLPFTDWIISIFILAVVHEFAHGVVARAHDLEVTSSGFAVLALLVPIIPAAFVEPNEKKMKKTKDIVQYSILAAGPVANIVLALMILFASAWIISPVEAYITEPVGFSFDIMNDSLPAGEAGLKDGTIIDMYNDKKINSYEEFYTDISYCVEPGEEITFGEGNSTYVITTTSMPGDETKPLIGINNIQNEAKIKEGYGWLAPFVFWLKSLFKWLFLLNLFIGLANLLPLGIVDGGRILQISLHKVMNNKKKAQKVWVFIAFLFLAFLLFGLLSTYLGNPFSFFG
ncbi:site-2 protease family protein [Candidatus Woesearchaeota archaeon]|jgi:hypothetical protein|nr:site-2 protease family protein [Candidatus Woesearchaeota archaeon]